MKTAELLDYVKKMEYAVFSDKVIVALFVNLEDAECFLAAMNEMYSDCTWTIKEV